MCAHRLPAAAPATSQLRKPHGLGAADVQAAAVALQATTVGWTLDQHQDSDGYLMLMITPPGPEESTPTFVLSGTASGIELAVALGDSCDGLGSFPSIAGALSRARHVMMASTADTMAVA